MNRRDAIKTAGAAVVSGMLASRAEPVAAGTPARSRAGGDFTITFRGPSMLFFDLADAGTKGFLHFTDFPYDPVCPMPTHVPEISIVSSGTACGRFGSKKSLRLAGLHLTPMMLDAFAPKDYKDVTAPASGAADKPSPTASGALDWSSLKWTPKLPVAVDTAALSDATITGVSLESGALIADEPHDPDARKALWIWANLDEWARAEASLKDALQSAATDVLKLKGRYENGKAVVKVGSLLDPGTTFDLEFVPPTDGDAIELLISAEPPSLNHAIQARPHMLYCSYYNVAATEVQLPDRVLPYLSPLDFDNKVQELGMIHGGYQPTPRPLCGTMRVIQ